MEKEEQSIIRNCQLPWEFLKEHNPGFFLEEGKKSGGVLFSLLLLFMWMGVLNSYMSVYHIHTLPEKARRGVSDP